MISNRTSSKEERVLFPMIRELVTTEVPSFHCGSLRNPISVMLREHDTVGDLLAELRRLTSGYSPPADGCASYAACFRRWRSSRRTLTCTSTRRTTCCSRWWYGSKPSARRWFTDEQGPGAGAHL